MPKTLFPNASQETRDRLEQDPTVKLFNTYDWSTNPLGPIPMWSESLKGAVRTMLVASTPMVMLVGAPGILLYNDAYARFAGNKHPQIFGMPALEAWPEIADFNRGNIERGLRSESWGLLNQELSLNRHGQLELAWMDLHYSPLVGDDGQSMGTLCIVHETTTRVLAERALARSEERLALALSGSNLVGTWDWDVVNDVVTADDRFANLYNLDPLRAGLGVPITDFLAAIHPDDAVRVRADIERSLTDGSVLRSEYRLVSATGQVRWVIASGRPRLDAEGKATRFPGVAVDVTEMHQVAQALAESEVRFRTLADTMPQMVWSTLPDGYHDYYNARWYDYTGMQPGTTDGEGWNGMFHPDDQERARQRWQHSLQTGEPYEIEYRLRHHSGEYRWTLGRALAVRDEAGNITRWFGTCTDINESRLLAEEREIVAQELSHRIKNIFAVLTGIIGLSARSRPEFKPFAEDLRHRIYALGEAHDFVRPHSHLSRPAADQSSLQALVGRLMSPYRGETLDRVIFEGDDTTIDEGAATPLALLFHELATNSAKYGALSAEAGLVVITGTAEEGVYRLRWKETGGPPVHAATQGAGFGTRLIGLSVEGQMHGKVERFWEADGLRVEIVIPTTSLRRTARLQSAGL